MDYSKLEIKEAESKSQFSPYTDSLLHFPHHYFRGSLAFSHCKEEANKYAYSGYYKKDWPEFIKALCVIKKNLNNQFLYEKFREIEQLNGLPESKVSILNVAASTLICYVPYQALMFEGYISPIERDVLIILLKKCMSICNEDKYYDEKGIVKLIFSDLKFYLPKLNDILKDKQPYLDTFSASVSCSYFGIKNWANMGCLDEVLKLKD